MVIPLARCLSPKGLPTVLLLVERRAVGNPGRDKGPTARPAASQKVLRRNLRARVPTQPGDHRLPGPWQGEDTLPLRGGTHNINGADHLIHSNVDLASSWKHLDAQYLDTPRQEIRESNVNRGNRDPLQEMRVLVHAAGT